MSKSWQALLLVSRLMRRYRLRLGQIKRLRQLLAPLLLLLLELLRLLSMVLLLRLPPRLLLALLLLFLPLLLNRAKPGGPGRPSRDGRGVDLLIHRAAVTYSDRIRLNPRSGRLGGSLLPFCPWG